MSAYFAFIEPEFGLSTELVTYQIHLLITLWAKIKSHFNVMCFNNIHLVHYFLSDHEKNKVAIEYVTRQTGYKQGWFSECEQSSLTSSLYRKQIITMYADVMKIG